jgi:hypothetical protein
MAPFKKRRGKSAGRDPSPSPGDGGRSQGPATLHGESHAAPGVPMRGNVAAAPPGASQAAPGVPMRNLDIGDVSSRQVPISDVQGRLRVEAAARASLALFFTALLIVTVVLAFHHVGQKDWENAKDLVEILIPAETALLGSAVGFYFGSRT